MDKTTLIFIRHGEVFNPKRILYGRLSRFRLSANGMEQIRQAAVKLAKYNVNLIYTSPLLRTRQTAGILSKKFNLLPKTSKLLIEVDTPFQGIALEKYKNEIQPKLYDSFNVKIGQESIEEIENRMRQFLNLIKKRHKGKIVLAVSHGDPIVILKGALSQNIFTWEYKKNNYLSTGNWIVVTIEKEKFILNNDQ